MRDNRADLPNNSEDQEGTKPPKVASDNEAAAKQTSASENTIAADSPVAPSPRDQDTSDPPKSFGRYDVLDVLGQGAFGTVYRGRDAQLKRDVAIKVPRSDVLSGRSAVERFMREAQAAATILHPNICPVYDVGTADGHNYIVMAFIKGKTLSEFARASNGLTPKVIASLVRKIALALATAHAKGVVHRDLKPANIMIDGERQEPVVMDFGLAQQADNDDARLTRDGAILGTPAYMSPEQAGGKTEDVGPASDIYSLGVVLYELLAGELPFTGPPVAVLAQVLNAEPPAPSSQREGVDRRLESICLKAIAKSPDDRYQSMQEFADTLRDYLRRPVSTSPTDPRIRIPKPDKQRSARPSRPAVVSPRATIGSTTRKRRTGKQTKKKPLPEPSSRSTAQVLIWLGMVGVVGVSLVGLVLFLSLSNGGTPVKFEFRGLPEGGGHTIWIDDVEHSPEELVDAVEFESGDHQIQVKWRGELLVDQTVTVESGKSQTVMVDVGEELFRQIELPMAEQLVNSGLILTVAEGKLSHEIFEKNQLPKGRFRVTGISLNAEIEGMNLDFDMLARLSWLTTARIHSGALPPDSFLALANSRSLRHLDLTGSNVVDDDMLELGRINQLQELKLDRTAVSDAGIGHISGLKKLTSLSLHETAVSDASFQTLKQLTTLRSLTVTTTRLDKDSIVGLKTALAGCHVTHDPFVDPRQQALAKWVLSNGGAVDIEIIDGSQRRVANTAELPLIKYHLVGIEFPPKFHLDDEAAKLLEDAVAVRKLSLEGSGFTNDDLSKLTPLAALEFLNLRGTQVTSAGLSQLKQFASLREIVLDGRQFDDDGLLALQALPNLSGLTCDGSKVPIRDLDWSQLAGLDSLTALSSINAGLDDADLEAIVSQSKLESLDLSGNSGITDKGVAILSGLASLKSLKLRGTGISNAAANVLTSLNTLTELDVTSTRLSYLAIAAVEKQHPGCRVVHDPTVSYEMDLDTPQLGSLPSGWVGDEILRIIQMDAGRAIGSVEDNQANVTLNGLPMADDFFVQIELGSLKHGFSDISSSVRLLGGADSDLVFSIVRFGRRDQRGEVRISTSKEPHIGLVYHADVPFSPAQIRLERRGAKFTLSIDGRVLSIGGFKYYGRNRSRYSVAGSVDDDSSTAVAGELNGTSFTSSACRDFEGIQLGIGNKSTFITGLRVGPLKEPSPESKREKRQTIPYTMVQPESGVPAGWKVFAGVITSQARLQLSKCEIGGDFSLRMKVQRQLSADKDDKLSHFMLMRLRGREAGWDLPLQLSIESRRPPVLVFPLNDPVTLSPSRTDPLPEIVIERRANIFTFRLNGIAVGAARRNGIVGTVRSTHYHDFDSIDFEMQKLQLTEFEIKPLD